MIIDLPDYWNNPGVGRYAVALADRYTFSDLNDWLRDYVGSGGHDWHIGYLSMPGLPNFKYKYDELIGIYHGIQFLWVHTEEHALMVNGKFGRDLV